MQHGVVPASCSCRVRAVVQMAILVMTFPRFDRDRTTYMTYLSHCKPANMQQCMCSAGHTWVLLATQVRRSTQHGPLHYRIQRPQNITCADLQENALLGVRSSFHAALAHWFLCVSFDLTYCCFGKLVIACHCWPVMCRHTSVSVMRKL